MSYRDFGFPAVIEQLGLKYADADLTAPVGSIDLRPEFVRFLSKGAELASGINTEKARSEFIIAPLLLETRQLTDGGFGIFSGVEFNVDANVGLVGICDFLLTRPARLFVISSPVVAITEVKNDSIGNAYGQCIATMRAAQIFNQRKGFSTPIFGVVSTGSDWRFLRLVEDSITFDRAEYYMADVNKIVGVIKHFVESVEQVPAAA